MAKLKSFLFLWLWLFSNSATPQVFANPQEDLPLCERHCTLDKQNLERAEYIYYCLGSLSCAINLKETIIIGNYCWLECLLVSSIFTKGGFRMSSLTTHQDIQ